MNALEILGSSLSAIAVWALVAFWSLPIYALLSVPGIVVVALTHRALKGHPRLRVWLTAGIFVVLLAPFPISGHSPVVLPLPFGVWLTKNFMEALISASITALLLALFSRWRVGTQALTAALNRHPRAPRGV